MSRALALMIAMLPIAPAAATVRMAETQLPCEQVESIGVATMALDGTITLRLRSLTPGPVAESTLVYMPDHPRYQDILKHLGGLAPGESRPVRPWC